MASENLNIVIKAVDKTKRSFRAVTMGLNAIKKVAFSMQTALIAVGVAGFGFLVKKSLDATDALGKLADKIGIGTAELGGLRYAAELTGVATNTLDMGLQRMVRRVSEAANGSGAAKDALIELGLSAKSLNNLAPDQQFKAIADAMEGVAGQGERVRLAMSLFDTEGVALINTLKGGSAAIIDMEQRAERMGLRLSGGLVKGVEKANDAITQLSSFISGLFARSIAELAPAIESITNSLTAWFEMKVSSAGGAGAIAKDMAVSIVVAAKAIISAFGSITNSIITLGNTAQSVSTFINNWFGDVTTEKARAEIAELDADINAITKSLSNPSNKGGYSKEIIADMRLQASLLKEQKQFTIDLINTGKTYTAPEIIEPVSIKGAIEGIDQVLIKLRQVNAVDVTSKPMATPIDSVMGDAEGNSLIGANEKEYQLAFDHQRKMADLNASYLGRQQADRSAAYGVAFEQQKRAGELSRISRFKDISDVKEEGKKALSNLSGHYKAAFALNKAFAIKDALVNTYKAISTALASAPYPFNIALAAAAALQGYAQVKSIRSTQFREKGGPITAGSPYMVGERGPELVVPNAAGSVVPNDQLGGGNYTINISANDTAGFDELLTKRRATIMNLINQSLNERGRPALA